MKKIVFTILSVVFIALGVNAQQISKNPFEGQTFIVNKYVDGELKNSEELIFQQKQFESSLYSKEGFTQTAYRAAQNTANGIWEFSCTMTNGDKEKLVWHGTNSVGTIKGNCIWIDGEQATVHYTFEGKVK